MNKPREFWVDINTAPEEGIFETFIANKLPSELSENENYFYMEDDRCMRVIEHSAYAALEEKLRVAVEALEKITKPYKDIGLGCYHEEIAREALANLKGEGEL